MGPGGRRNYVRRLKMNSGCQDCGYREHYAALEFDHLPEHDKLFAISAAVNQSVAISDEDFFAEIKKCEIVCANCHRVRTVGRISATARRLLMNETRAM